MELDACLLITVGLCLAAAYGTLIHGYTRTPFIYFLVPPILSCWWFGPVYGAIAVGIGAIGGTWLALENGLSAMQIVLPATRYAAICAVPMTIAIRMQRHVRKREALLAQLVEVDHRREEFFANLSHEMRTPMNSIRGYCHLLTKYGAKDQQITEKAAEVMTRSVEHLDRLIEDMLDVSLVMTGGMRLNPEIINPCNVVAQAIEGIRLGVEAKGIRLNHRTSAEPMQVRADPARLQQVLWNLLSNALKFTPEGGMIAVSVARERRTAVISVRDTGIGIDRNYLPRVFERFSQENSSPTREVRGLGLGLSIAKNLVDLMGGTLEAQSPGPGRGSTFTARLPIVD
jgi:signal transduction histidine kinase